jgi:hypothetical protein
MIEPIPLRIWKRCRDCGELLKTDVAWEEHYRFCPGPIRLVFIDEGDPVGEVGSE